MKIEKIAYNAGIRRALHDYAEKRAGRVSTFAERLLGRNVKRTVGEQTKKVMELPAVTRHGTPDDLSSVRSYVKGTLKEKPAFLPDNPIKPPPSDKELMRELKEAFGRKPSAAEFTDFKAHYAPPPPVDKGMTERAGIIEQLLKGQKAVKAETAATRRARLGLGAAAVPTIGAGMFAPSLLKESVDLETAAPVAAGVAAGSYPIAQGLSSRALALKKPKGKVTSDIQEIRKAIRRGDIFLESYPGFKKKEPFKPLISMLGSDPTVGHHVGVVGKGLPDQKEAIKKLTADMGRKPTPFELKSYMEHVGIESYEATARAAGTAKNPEINPKKDFTIRRFKDSKHVEPFMKNVERMHARENIVEKLLGYEAANKMYDKPTSVKAGIGSFLPAKVQQWWAKKSPADPGRAVCSSLPGMCSPVELAKGVPGERILPHHVYRSPALETPLSYIAPRNAKQKWVDRAFRASPWALRGALGAGLGYGAYRGIKALMD